MNINEDNLEAIIQRYILDQLDDGDTEEFEAYFLCRPDIADRVSSTQKLRAGLELLDDQNVAVEHSAGSTKSASVFERLGLNKLGELFSGPAPAFAMAALLVCLSPFAIKGLSLSDDNAHIQLVSLQSAVVRSAENDTDKGINLSVTRGQAAVIVRVKEVRYPSYFLSVKTEERANEVWRSKKFEFASGSRDSLVLIPSHASIDSVNVQLYGLTEQGQEEPVAFCDYTESCF